jgi:hypothetical protein
MIDQSKEIIDLQDKVDDLRWRMNAVCNFLNLQYPDLIDNVTSLYMKEEIQELKQPEPKYKPGDEVWISCWSVNDANRHGYNFIRGFVIPNRDHDKNLSEPYVRIKPCSPSEGGDYSAPESFVYASREELIDSQIKHWQSLKEQEEKPRIYDVKSFVSSYNKACDAFINGILTDTDIEVDEKQSDYIHTHSTKCPKCSKQRVADGMCWEIGCDYKDCIHLASPYSPIDLLEPCRQKCIKCGEFY